MTHAQISNDATLRELKDTRLKLSQAERRAAAALEAHDACASKLEDTQGQLAELARRIDAMASGH